MNAPARINDNPLVQFNTQMEQRAPEFKKVLPAHISPEKFQRTIITAVTAAPDLLQADRRSLVTACMKAAQDGLLPDGREAALVVFKTSQKDDQGKWSKVAVVQYMPMVYGLRKKILQSGEITDIQTGVVYRQEIEAGLFVYEEGTERQLRHKPMLDPAFDPIDDDIAASYSVATFKDGSKSFEVMPRRDINKIRQTSKTGALGKSFNGKPVEPKGSWVDWFSEMARKSVMRRHSKTLPMSGDLIDIEPIEDRTESYASQLLHDSVPNEPEPVPTDRQLKQQRSEQAEQESADPETGEVNEVRESSQSNASEPDSEGESEQQISEQLDNQTYAQVDGKVEQEAVEDDADPVWLATYERLIPLIEGASDLKRLKAVESDFVNNFRIGFPDKQIAEIEKTIAVTRKRLS